MHRIDIVSEEINILCMFTIACTVPRLAPTVGFCRSAVFPSEVRRVRLDMQSINAEGSSQRVSGGKEQRDNDVLITNLKRQR